MKLVLLYTLIAGVISAVTAPIPGTSLLLTALEVYMIVHLSKVHDAKLGLEEIGISAIALYGLARAWRGTWRARPAHQLGEGLEILRAPLKD